MGRKESDLRRENQKIPRAEINIEEGCPFLRKKRRIKKGKQGGKRWFQADREKALNIISTASGNKDKKKPRKWPPALWRKRPSKSDLHLRKSGGKKAMIKVGASLSKEVRHLRAQRLVERSKRKKRPQGVNLAPKNRQRTSPSLAIESRTGLPRTAGPEGCETLKESGSSLHRKNHDLLRSREESKGKMTKDTPHPHSLLRERKARGVCQKNY